MSYSTDGTESDPDTHVLSDIESPPPISSIKPNFSARPSNDNNISPLQGDSNDGTMPRFHCHQCKRKVPANGFIHSQNKGLCNSCNRCRHARLHRISVTEIRSFLFKLMEREKQFLAGDLLPPTRTRESRITASKSTEVSTVSRPVRVPRRFYRLPEREESEEEEVDEEEDGTESQTSPIEDRRSPLPTANAAIMKQLSEARATLTSLSSTVSALRDEVATLASGVYRVGASCQNGSKELGGRDAATGASLTDQLYPWIAPGVVKLVGDDRLKPENLTRLRNPDSRLIRDVPAQQLVPIPPQVVGVSAEEALFLAAVPNVRAFAQLWNTYVDLRSLHQVDHTYIAAYNFFLARILDLDSIYSWEKGLCQYVLAVCRHRFGTAAASDWRLDHLSSSIVFLNPYATLLSRE